MDFSTHAMLLVAFLTLVGAALGAAVAHWKRGPGHLVLGGIIGGLATFMFAFVSTVYAGIIGVLGILALALLLVLGSIFA